MDSPDLPDQEVQSLIRSLNSFQWTCWRSSSDPTASQALARLRRPVAELMLHVVGSLLEEMRGSHADPQVQAMGLQMLRALIRDSQALKRIVLERGGVEVLVRGLQQHPNDEQLLTGTLEAIHELHGVSSLLQALDHLRESPSGVRAALWAFSASAREKWHEVQKLPAHELVRVVLAAVDAHKDDHRILASGVELLAELAGDMPETRSSFAALGGWDWLFRVLELHFEDSVLQRHGCRLLSALGRGGSWAEAHSQRAIVVLERTMCQHESDERVLYWAFWAVQQLNGARALVVPMRGGTFKTPSAMVAALHSLACVSFGQGEGAETGDMPDIIEAVLTAMEAFSERYDVLYGATVVLGRVASFVVGACNDAAAPQQWLSSVERAIFALVRLMSWRLADANTVYAVCDALAQIVDASFEASPVRQCIRLQLFSQDAGGQGEHLIARIVAAHVSNDHLQAAVMWLSGMVNGVGPLLQQMSMHRERHEIQLPAIKTLSWLYAERIELEANDADCLPGALRTVMEAMARFPENIILQQHACYALCAIMEHNTENQPPVGEEGFTQVATAAAEALRLVRGRCDGRQDPASYNALYLRKEATRCIVTVCAARPALSRWFRNRGLQDVLADALKSTAQGVWDGKRDAEAEETLRLELLALSYVLGPETAIVEPLRRWGGLKPAVVRAAADAVVDLVRSSMHQRPQQETSDPVVAAISTPVQALSAAGCGAELLAAMQAHANDEDLQGRLQLAAGFMGCNCNVAPAA